MNKKYEVIIKETSYRKVFYDKSVSIIIRKYSGDGLEPLQTAVGGYIEAVRPSDILPLCKEADSRFTVYCDEEGLLKRRCPAVRKIEILDETEEKYIARNIGMVCGDVVVRGFNGIDDDEPLTADDVLDVVHSLWLTTDGNIEMDFDDLDTRLEMISETIDSLDRMSIHRDMA